MSFCRGVAVHAGTRELTGQVDLLYIPTIHLAEQGCSKTCIVFCGLFCTKETSVILRINSLTRYLSVTPANHAHALLRIWRKHIIKHHQRKDDDSDIMSTTNQQLQQHHGDSSVVHQCHTDRCYLNRTPSAACAYSVFCRVNKSNVLPFKLKTPHVELRGSRGVFGGDGSPIAAITDL